MSSDLYERALGGPSIPLTRTTSRFLEYYRTSVEMKFTTGTVYKARSYVSQSTVEMALATGKYFIRNKALDSFVQRAAHEDHSLLPKPIVSIASGERAYPVSSDF